MVCQTFEMIQTNARGREKAVGLGLFMSLKWNVFIFILGTKRSRQCSVDDDENAYAVFFFFFGWFLHSSSSYLLVFVYYARHRIGLYASLNDDFGLQIENNSRQIYGCNMVFYIISFRFLPFNFTHSPSVLCNK